MAEKERYSTLDGFRAFAALGIILMHVRANSDFAMNGFVYENIIASFTHFTSLFMLLSAFSMCCGYYERFKNNNISLEEFYKRRYQRIWPFFALLCTVELIVDHSVTSFYEWFADLTLAYGLLPNANISVVGVGWFLGVIFVFYMIFPFFVFLMGNKKRAWMVMGITVVLNILCQIYFFNNDHVVMGMRFSANLAYSAVFFTAGGLIYLYREKIKKINVWLIVAATVIATVLYYTVNDSVYMLLILFSLLSMCGICAGGGIAKSVFQNKAVQFLASISMEIYLCHMFVFRILEKVKMLHLVNSDVVNYILASVITICGAIVISTMWKRLFPALRGFINGKTTH